MKRLTGILPALILLLSASGCAWTAAERQEFIDEAAPKIVAKVKEEIVPPVVEKVVQATSKAVDSLDDLTNAEKAKVKGAIKTQIEKDLPAAIDEKLLPAVKKGLDKILPAASDDTSGGGNPGGGFPNGSWLVAALPFIRKLLGGLL